jgi:excisionase family DNA binding protein
MARILTVEQAAKKLQMTPKVVREYLRVGKLPGRKVGRAWRVLESDIERWISTGQSDRGPRVSARGFLKRFPGKLSSEEFVAERRAEAEEEERRLKVRTKAHKGAAA